MRVLFYVEPLPEKRPLAKRGWLSFVENFIQSLRSDDPDEDEFFIVVPEALEALAKARFPGIAIAAMPASDLVPALGPNTLTIASRWYEGTADDQATSRMIDVLRAKTGAFEPDVCLTLSPAPFLSQTFPRAGIIHFEYGLFSRAPFPETGFLDPFGMYRGGALGRFKDEIRNFKPSARDSAAVATIRQILRTKMQGDANPLGRVVTPHLENARATVLVPLQLSDSYTYQCHSAFTDQTDLVRHVLEQLPSDVAVIVCEHPEHPIFDDETLGYYKARFPNLVWSPEFRSIYAAGQYLVDFADVVVTVSSSVGLQAAFWDKKLIVLGASHLDVVADAHAMSEFETVLKRPQDPSRDAALTWMLTRYDQSFDTLFDSKQLRATLERVAAETPAAHGFSWFRPFSRPKELTNLYRRAAERWFAPFTSPTSRSDVTNVSLYSAVAGGDFSEQTCARATAKLSAQATQIELRTPKYGSPVERLKLRLADAPITMFVHGITVANSAGAVLWRLIQGASEFNKFHGMIATDLHEQNRVLLEIVSSSTMLDIHVSGDANADELIVTISLAEASVDEIASLRTLTGRRAADIQSVVTAVNTAKADAQAGVAQIDMAVRQAGHATEHAITRLAEQHAALAGPRSSDIQNIVASVDAVKSDVRAGVDHIDLAVRQAGQTTQLAIAQLAEQHAALAGPLSSDIQNSVASVEAVKSDVKAGVDQIDLAVRQAGQTTQLAIARLVDQHAGLAHELVERAVSRLAPGVSASIVSDVSRQIDDLHRRLLANVDLRIDRLVDQHAGLAHELVERAVSRLEPGVSASIVSDVSRQIDDLHKRLLANVDLRIEEAGRLSGAQLSRGLEGINTLPAALAERVTRLLESAVSEIDDSAGRKHAVLMELGQKIGRELEESLLKRVGALIDGAMAAVDLNQTRQLNEVDERARASMREGMGTTFELAASDLARSIELSHTAASSEIRSFMQSMNSRTEDLVAQNTSAILEELKDIRRRDEAALRADQALEKERNTHAKLATSRRELQRQHLELLEKFEQANQEIGRLNGIIEGRPKHARAARKQGVQPVVAVARSAPAPHAAVMPGAVAPDSFQRRVALRVWRLLPSKRIRERLKDKAFRTFPSIFRTSRTYREWASTRAAAMAAAAAAKASSAGPVENLPAVHAANRTLVSTTNAGVSPSYVARRTDGPPARVPARVVAFYLPQFHPIPENDAWWGTGFTEWTNVTKAVPQYQGHYQPHVPDELGYYDLRAPEVQERQAEFAKLYGVGGICFYFYWFAGKRLLERPILQWLENPRIDTPFCLCWANENWSRRWDGLDAEILIGQDHSVADDIAFISYISMYLRDARYIRISGKPLLLVYRPSLLPDAKATAERWRKWCRENGIGEIYLALTQSFDIGTPESYGFDAAVEFPPNNMGPPDITSQITRINPDFSGVVYDYDFYVSRSERYTDPGYTLFRSAFPSWDNEARRKGRGTSFLGAQPAKFERFVRNAVEASLEAPNPDERLVFINAWNEWAEGAHLEPDKLYGFAWLDAIRNALESASGPRKGGRLVLVVHDAYRHGAQFLALNLARTFSTEFSIELEIVILGDGPLKSEFSKFGKVHSLAGIDPCGREAQALARSLKTAGFNHAICNTMVTGLFLKTLAEAGIDCNALIHELPGVMSQYGLDKHFSAIRERAKLAIYPSEFVRRKLGASDDARSIVRTQGLYKTNGSRTGVEREAARARLRSHFGIPQSAKVVLTVGYGDKRKGIDLWHDLGARVLAKDPNVYFVWVGEIEVVYRDTINSAINATGAASHFILPGFQSVTDDFYAGADVYALTSREDPFPTVIMEAMDVAIPIVAFDGAGGFSELLQAGVGKVVPMLDVGAFSEALLSLLRNDDVRIAMGLAGKDKVGSDFSHRRYCFDLLARVGIKLPRVSVVVPNYNYARLLADRFQTIANQTCPIYELIVLDDCSSDGSIEVVQDLLSKGTLDWRLIANTENSGSPCKQWLKGVEAATGDIVWIAEADDLALPGFVESLLAAFHDPNVVMSYSQSKQMAQDGTILCEDYLDYVSDIDPTKWSESHVSEGIDEIRSVLSVRNTIPNVSACLFRRDVLLRALSDNIDEITQFRIAGDWATYVHVAAAGKVAFNSLSMNLHRRHEQSVTLGAKNEKLLNEILTMQNIVAGRFNVPPAKMRHAKEYAQQLYEQFGFAEHGPSRVDLHPAFQQYFGLGSKAAE